jgi:putative acetyltransferase
MIRGERTNLRAVERRDAVFVHQLLNDPTVGAGWGTDGVPRSIHAVEADLEHWIESERTTSYPLALVIETIDGDAAGLVLLVRAERFQQSMITLSIAIAADHRRQGNARDALVALVNILHEEWNVHRVQLTCEAANAAAIALYESIGFHRDATKRDATYSAGGYHDQHIFSALPGDSIG